jgi:c-di-GMP-binding flagellar brake protein YcgR
MSVSNLQMQAGTDSSNVIELAVKSSDAIAMVAHGSELTYNITTPVGIKYLGSSRFIGTQDESLILMELPVMTDSDRDYFFQPGFWINVRAISQRGEGALIHFRSQIQHLITDPISLAVITLPPKMRVEQLRKEARYDVALDALGLIDEKRFECEIRDLSRGGCRMMTSPLIRQFKLDDVVKLQVKYEGKALPNVGVLSGTICNQQNSQHYAKYGVAFDDIGQQSVKVLLAQLKFDGTKLALKT